MARPNGSPNIADFEREHGIKLIDHILGHYAERNGAPGSWRLRESLNAISEATGVRYPRLKVYLAEHGYAYEREDVYTLKPKAPYLPEAIAA